MTRRALLVIALLVLLVPSSGIADPPPRGPSFEGETSVLEVHVPVQVVDGNGEPVRGLEKDDFRILEGRKERDITSLEVVDLERLDPAEPDGTDLTELVPPPARRYFLLLFDLSFSTPSSILRARDAARNFVLQRLHPSDLAAVMVFSIQRGPRLLVTFTPDRAQVARAIDLIGAPDLLDRHRARDPLAFMIEDPAILRGGSESALASEDGRDVSDVIDAEIGETTRLIHKRIDMQNKAWDRGRITSWARSLEELGRVLDNVKGRKHVVYFSEGFDGRLVLGRGADAGDESIREDRRSLDWGQYWEVDTDDIYGETVIQNDIRKMLTAFKRSNAVVQAIDISGLRADHASSLRGREVGQHVLFYVANETGGQLFSDANRFGEQLGRVLESTQVTYLLTFEVDDIELDGSYHEIEVEVDGPRGARVSHREGYYAPQPYEDLHPFEKRLLTANAIATAAATEEIGLSVLASPFFSSSGNAYVPVIVEILGEDLLRGHPESGALPVEIYAYVTDEKGEMADFFTQRIELDPSRGREKLRESGLKYYGHLDLGPGEHLLRVLVRNGATGRRGLETLSVRVPLPDAGEPMLLGPFFPEPPDRWILIRERSEDPEADSVIYPFTVEEEIYVPSALAEIPAGDPARMILVGYHLDASDLSLTSRVLDREGTEMGGDRVEMVRRADSGLGAVDKFVMQFTSEGLDPGLYDLEVTLRNEETTRTARASLRIR